MTKAVVITGGTGGLGKAVCLAFLVAGYRVTATYISDKELQDLLDATAKYKERLTVTRVDVTKEDSLGELVAQTKKNYGKLDALVCLVGGFAPGTFGEGVGDSFDKMMTLNAKTFLLTCNALLPLLEKTKKEYSHIVAVSAKPAFEPAKNLGVYAASKAAVASLVKSMSVDLLDKNICVNAIAPSTIDTPANRQSMPKADPDKWVTPEKIAESIVYLATDYSAATSGTILPVYGKS